MTHSYMQLYESLYLDRSYMRLSADIDNSYIPALATAYHTTLTGWLINQYWPWPHRSQMRLSTIVATTCSCIRYIHHNYLYDCQCPVNDAHLYHTYWHDLWLCTTHRTTLHPVDPQSVLIFGMMVTSLAAAWNWEGSMPPINHLAFRYAHAMKSNVSISKRTCMVYESLKVSLTNT